MEDLPTMPTHRLYVLNNDGIDFSTGNSSAGEQLLIGVYLGYRNECIRAFFFDKDGVFRRLEKRPLTLERGIGIASLGNRQIRSQIITMVRAWKEELGFFPGAVYVRRFDVDRVGITDRPEDHQAFLDGENAGVTTDEERMEMLASIKRWEEAKRFVFWWGKDYWMNSDGTVEST
jgi:hypothetical protein